MTVTDRRLYALAAVALILMALRACVSSAQDIPQPDTRLAACEDQLSVAMGAWKSLSATQVTSCRQGFFYRMVLVDDDLREVAISDPAECTSDNTCSYRADGCPTVEGVGGVYPLPEPSFGVSLAVGAIAIASIRSCRPSRRVRRGLFLYTGRSMQRI